MIEAGIRTLLLSQSSITALVKPQKIDTKTFDGVFLQKAEEGFKPPFIVIGRGELDPMACLDGTTGMESSDLTISCLALSSGAAGALAKAVTDYFKDYKGAAGSADTIDAVIWNDSSQDEEPPPDGSDRPWMRVDLDFTVQHHTT